jgi:uncharacterized membrane protein
MVAGSSRDPVTGKFVAIILIPLVTLSINFLFLLIPLIEPRQQYLKLSMKTYNIILIGTIALMGALHFISVMNGLDKPISVTKSAPVILGLMFLIIGNYMGKIRSNFMIRIKTPWTLSSELSWNKTHRLGGKLFILSGFVTILSAIFSTGLITFVIFMITCSGTVITAFVYSYIIWKNDPHKRTDGAD